MASRLMSPWEPIEIPRRAPVRVRPFWLHGKHARSLSTVCDPQKRSLADVVRVSARRWERELAFRVPTDHVTLHHRWSATPGVLQVHHWWCLILAPVFPALQVERAEHAGVEVGDLSRDGLIRRTPGRRAHGVTPWEHAVCAGRDPGRMRPSTRHRIEVLWMDPRWVVPPPQWAL